MNLRCFAETSSELSVGSRARRQAGRGSCPPLARCLEDLHTVPDGGRALRNVQAVPS